MTENAYIHIPFCVKKCNYCAFVSYSKLQKKNDYVKALVKEISANYKEELLQTLYFGGGTPGLLSINDVTQIVSPFKLKSTTEVTFEVNPNKLSYDFLTALRKAGINRLSIGAQSFDNAILKQIGRLHSSEDIEIAVKNARKAGFDNISLDLIYGLPNQSLKNFEQSLNSAIKLGVEHISLYGLKIEDGTFFAQNLPQNLPDDDLQADMYLLASEFLRSAGFKKYEISNFCRDGFESRHNLNYWDANTYYGFGCGAHGYENKIRYENENDLENYIQNPLKKLSKTHLTQQNILEEMIFLGFRKAEGIDIHVLKEQFNYDFYKSNRELIKLFLGSKHLLKTQRGYAFSDNGFLLSNEILCQFVSM